MTAETAILLSRALGTTPEPWLDLGVAAGTRFVVYVSAPAALR